MSTSRPTAKSDNPKLDGRVTMLFLLIAAALVGVMAAYWVFILEPRLNANADTHARVLAQAQTQLLAATLSNDPTRDQMVSTVDQILILTDQNTHLPFVRALKVEVDYDTVTAPTGSLDVFRGERNCDDCFVSELPIYANNRPELLGIATFYSSSAFLQELKADVRYKLLFGSGIVLMVLLLAWRAMARLTRDMQDNQERFRRVFDAAPFPMAMTRLGDGALLHINRAAYRFFRIPPDQLHSYTSADLFLDRQQQAKLLRQVQLKGLVDGQEVELTDGSDNRRWALVSIYPLSHDPQEAAIIGVADISERRRAEQALREVHQRFVTVVDSLDALVYVADMHSHELLFANNAMEQKRNAVVGRPCWEIFYPQANGPCPGCTNSMLLDSEGNPTAGLHRESFDEQRNHWYSCTDRAIPWVDGRLVRIEVATDITELKRAHQELENARDAAESATRTKSMFLANMSHEIRTPLNAVVGLSHLLRRTELKPKQRDYTDRINAAAQSLLGIINDILDFSKIEAGKLVLEHVPFDINQVFDNLAAVVALRAQEKGLEVVYDIDPNLPSALVGDPLRLEQILFNLTNNAAKFTERGEIVIHVHRLSGSEPNELFLQFSVTDTGIGIPEDKLRTLFDSFTQVDGSISRKYGGTGLGLAISRELVGLMEGEIWAESVQDRGSTFHFTARCGIAEDSDNGFHTSRLPDGVDALRILVVDDNHSARTTLKTMLDSMSLRCDAVSSGAEAMEGLETALRADDPYGLLLVDSDMPRMDGMALIQRLRNDNRFDSLRTILMLTAHGHDILAVRGDAAHPDALLNKPVTPSSLFDGIVDLYNPIAAKARQSAAIARASVRYHGNRVLVVEDNATNRQVAREFLQQMGLHVDSARDGEEGVAMVRDGDYELVFMDIQMPRMDGLEATRILRTDTRLSTLPIVAMTAHAMVGDRDKSLAAGMNDHLTKPLDPNLLEQTVARWLPAPDHPATRPAPMLRNDEPSRPLPESQPGINVSAALEAIQGQQALLPGLFAGFLEQHRADSERLDTAFSKAELRTVQALAHGIKGSATYIGAERLAHAAQQVHDTLVRGAVPRVTDVAEFAAALEEALGSLEQICAAEADRPSTALDQKALEEELQLLLRYLLEGDALSEDSAVRLCEISANTSVADVCREILALVNDVEYEQALRQARTLLRNLQDTVTNSE